MGGKVAVITAWTLIVIADAIRVNITDRWRPDFGWVVICSWEMPSNDTLQSVRLSHDGQQFLIYRPEKHGPVKTDVFRTPEREMIVNCGVTEPGGQRGQCELSVEPFQPPVHNFAVKCEVSGERPTFRIEEQQHSVKILVPPSNAEIDSKTKQEESQARVSLNCSSYGLPAPNLLWTVTDDKVQADFTGRAWNATSKLWHVWSFLSYTPVDQTSTVTCTPVANVDGESVKGIPAEYNSARRYLNITPLISIAALALHLVR